MTEFDKDFFRPVKFTEEEIQRFLENANHDLEIAQKDSFPEVCFTYSFQALIKSGIALIAKIGQVKIRSMPGHHAKILEKMSEILKDADFLKIGNAMRTKRNTDLYGGGTPISEKEAKDYLRFTEGVIRKIEKVVG